MENIKERINDLPTSEIKKLATMLMDSKDKEADVLIQVTLDVLETKIDEPEFVKFCEEL